MAHETQQRHVIITTAGGATVKISDFQKATYTEIIYSWGPISSTKIDPVDYTSTPGQCSFVVANNVTINSVSRFSKITGLVFADVKIYQNNVLIFWGTIEDLTNIGNVDVTIQCIGKDAELSKLFTHTTVEKTAFPYALRSDVGKMLPVVYGTPKRVPFLGIDVGASGFLKYAIQDDETDIELSDADDAAIFPSSGSVTIDNELVEYTGKTGSILTGCVRENNPVYHKVNAPVSEVKAERLYAIDEIISDITAVFLGDQQIYLEATQNNMEIRSAYYFGDHPTYPGITCIGITFLDPSTGLPWSPPNPVNNEPTDTARFFQRAEYPEDHELNGAGSANPPEVTWPGVDDDGGALAVDVVVDRFQTCYDNQLHGYGIPYNGSGAYCGITFRHKFSKGMPSSRLEAHFLINTHGTDVRFIFLEMVEYYNSILTEDPDCPTWGTFELDRSTIDADETEVHFNFVWPKEDPEEHIQIYDVHFVEVWDGITQGACFPDCPSCGDETLTPFPPPPQKFKSAFNILSGDSVFADVVGIDNGASPATVYDSPEAICEDIITNRCGLSISIDHDVTSYLESVAILQPPDVRALLARIAKQAGCLSFFTPSEHRLKMLIGSQSTDAVISAIDIFQNQAWLNYTNKSHIANRITAIYNYFWWGRDAGRDTVEAEDAGSPSSQNTYGVIDLSESFPYIQDETHAQAIVDWRLLDLKEPRLVLEVIGSLTNNINRKIGDIVTIDTTDTYLDEMLAGMVSETDQFLITNMVFQPDGAIRLETVRV